MRRIGLVVVLAISVLAPLVADASRAGKQVRSPYQSQDGQDTESRDPVAVAITRCSGDRVAVLDQRGQLLRAAVGFAGCAMPSYDRAFTPAQRALEQLFSVSTDALQPSQISGGPS